MRVVFPAPGCADTTTPRDRRRCSTISGTNGSTGSGSLSSGDANADGASHARAAEAAVTVRILREVLLMVVLRVIKLRRGDDLCRDLRVAGRRQLLLIHVARGFRRFALIFARVVDPGAILRPDVITLPHSLRGIVAFPEHLQQVFVADLLRIEHDEHDLRMIRRAAADLSIRRVLRVSGRVTDGCRVHTRLLPELLFGAPEATHAEDRNLRSFRKRRRDRMLADEMWSHALSFPGAKSRAAPFMQ